MPTALRTHEANLTLALLFCRTLDAKVGNAIK